MLSISLIAVAVILLGVTAFGFCLEEFGHRMSYAGAGPGSPAEAARIDTEHMRHEMILGGVAVIALTICALGIWRWPWRNSSAAND